MTVQRIFCRTLKQKNDFLSKFEKNRENKRFTICKLIRTCYIKVELHSQTCYYIQVVRTTDTKQEYRDVAQFGSASGLGPEGRRFESCHPDQKVWEFSSAGRASALQAGCHRFEPCNSHHFLNNVLKYDAGVAQLVEQLICNQQVAGSSPITSSKQWESSRVAKGGRL